MLDLYVVLCLLMLGLNPSHGSDHGPEWSGMEEYCCATNSGDDCFPSHSELYGLDQMIEGYIVVPGMYEYINQSHMYNTLEQRFPSVIVMVKSEYDIQHAVLFARKYNLRVTIRSSGLDYMGRSTADGSLNINLSLMKDYDVTLDSTRHASGEIKVHTGLTWMEIYTLLDGYDRVIVGPYAKDVTPGGFTLGGGHSPISKMFGYAVDNLLEVQVVLPDGRIATCTETETMIENVDGKSGDMIPNGDLFWALRGGGGGTFGVVVYYVFKIHQAPASIVYFNTSIPFKLLNYDLDFTDDIFDFIKSFNTLPPEWGGSYVIHNWEWSQLTGEDEYVNIHGGFMVHFNKFGPWDGTELDTFRKLIDFCNQLDVPYTFLNISRFTEYAELANDPPIIRLSAATTMLQPEKQTEEFTDLFKQALFDTLRGKNFGCTGVLLGGHVRDFSSDSTPLHPGYRTASAHFACGIELTEDFEYQYPTFHQATLDDMWIPLGDVFSERLQHFGKGMSLNVATKNDPNWRQNFWGDHYERLLAIKSYYDPGNFLTCHHCVGSEFRHQTGDNGHTNTAPGIVCSYLSIMFAVFSLLFGIHLS